MSSFEFDFSLFGLLLGLSLAEVLGGFARALKRHGRHKLGLLTPMLSIFLLWDITTFWISAYRLRDAISMKIAVLVAGLIVTGLDYVAAVLVWPETDDGAAWRDLDGWTMAHKRQVLLSVFGANAVSFASAQLLAPYNWHLDAVDYTLVTLYFRALPAGAFAPGKKSTAAVLTLLLMLYAFDLVASLAIR